MSDDDEDTHIHLHLTGSGPIDDSIMESLIATIRQTVGEEQPAEVIEDDGTLEIPCSTVFGVLDLLKLEFNDKLGCLVSCMCGLINYCVDDPIERAAYVDTMCGLIRARARTTPSKN